MLQKAITTNPLFQIGMSVEDIDVTNAPTYQDLMSASAIGMDTSFHLLQEHAMVYSQIIILYCLVAIFALVTNRC